MKQFGILEDSTVYCAPKSRLKLKNEYSFDNAYNDWNADTMKKYNFFTGRFLRHSIWICLISPIW